MLNNKHCKKLKLKKVFVYLVILYTSSEKGSDVNANSFESIRSLQYC